MEQDRPAQVIDRLLAWWRFLWAMTRLGTLAAAVGALVAFSILDVSEGVRATALAIAAAATLASVADFVRTLYRRAVGLFQDYIDAVRQGAVITTGPDGADKLGQIGCDAIYSDRRDAMPAIAIALSDHFHGLAPGPVHLIGISLKKYFHPDGYSLDSDVFGVDTLEAMLHNRLSTSQHALHGLLLMPNSPEGIHRRLLEENDYTLRDMNQTVDVYSRWLQDHKGLASHVKLGHYTFRPNAMIVVTDQYAFEQRYMLYPPPGFEGRCFGDVLPVFRYAAGTTGYVRLQTEANGLAKDKDVQWIDAVPVDQAAGPPDAANGRSDKPDIPGDFRRAT